MDIGIDLGGSHIGVGLIDGSELKNTVDKFFTEEDRKNIENAILKNIDELINNILNQNSLLLNNIQKIGVSTPGTVVDGKIRATNLGLEFFNLKKALEERYNMQIKIRNDGKCAALAEKKYGVMKDYDDCVFVNIGTGVGGAAFIGGKLLEPKRFSGFEFGHMTIEKDGILCTCGKRGCFERYASIKSLKTRIINKLGIDGRDISGQILREVIMVQHHNEIQEEIDNFINYLKIGISNLIDIFEPEIICFGGSFSYYEGHPVFNRFLEELNKPNSTFNQKIPEIKTAYLKNDAGIIGAVID